MATVNWLADESPKAAYTEDELTELLQAISRATNPDSGVAAIVHKPSGQDLFVIMAGDCWCLIWFPEGYPEHDINSYHTLAEGVDPLQDPLCRESDVVSYYLHDDHGEVPLEYTIPEKRALNGIVEFLKSPDLPGSIQWQPD